MDTSNFGIGWRRAFRCFVFNSVLSAVRFRRQSGFLAGDSSADDIIHCFMAFQWRVIGRGISDLLFKPDFG